MDHTHEENDDEWMSKTTQKKLMHELQTMGESLLDLKASELATVPISDTMQEAIDIAKKLKTGNTKRRQLQLIGKLMRSEDHEAIKDALDQLVNKNKYHHRHNTEANRWQNLLIDEGTDRLTQFIEQYPHSDRQTLGQLIRSARKEASASEESPGKYSKRLFDLVLEIIKAAS